MNPVPIDPWDLALPAYLFTVSVAPSELDPYYTQLHPNDFYRQDEHITGAALALHPLLGKDAVWELRSAISFAKTMRDWDPGTLFPELGALTDEPAVHLLIRGRARLVASLEVGGTTQRWVVAQYGVGQWIGLPHLLRAFDQRARAWPQCPIRLDAETLGPGSARTQSMPLPEALALLASSADFRRFVEHHVAIRFARRREMMQRVRDNPLLRLLPPAGREYLLQLGAIVSAPDGDAAPYLSPGPPSGRAALLLRGEASLLLPGDSQKVMRYGATLRPGDLVGHEGLLMDAEWSDQPPDDVTVVEPERTTEVRLAPKAQVLQLYWYALRWVLDDRKPVWTRVRSIVSAGRFGIDAPLPTLVTFHAARPGLGTTALACGTGVALANSSRRMVVIVDLQGPENFAARWQARGFTTHDYTVALQTAGRAQRKGEDPMAITCHILVPPADVRWPLALAIVWPLDRSPETVENLVDAVDMGNVGHVIVAGRDAETSDLMKQVLARLQGRCGAVFYVCDDSGTPYPGAEPEHLTWIYRMTPGYLATEQSHARRVRFDWLFAGAIEAATAPVQRTIEALLGYSPSAELERESIQGARRVVRVPDDPDGAEIFDRCEFGKLVGANAGGLALGRAFARLARVVDRCTVGLALGGGGAWGFSHVALLRNLEDKGVPIDYIAGTSFGAVVGALYAAGGMRALELLVDENSARGHGLGPMLRAFVGGSLNRALLVAPFTSVAVEAFINDELRAAGVTSAGDPPCLGATEVPFYPVGTNLGTHEPLALPHASVGWGVRMSGSLPPMFPSLLRRYDRIADGAFIANVPSRVVREVGAHFVISANVVPPPPRSSAPKSLAWNLLTWLPRKALERLEDTVRGVFVLAWKAGQDQGALAADYALDLRPKVANSFEMWRGRRIVDEIEAEHFTGDKADRIRNAWERFGRDGGRTLLRGAS
jgi:predicted acylesterase/phospholipase RssA